MTETPNIENLLDRHGVTFRVHGREAIARCPQCQSGGKRELTWSVNIDTGTFICNRANHCGWRGSLRDLLDYFGEAPSRGLRVAPVPAKPKAYKDPDRSQVKGLTQEHHDWFKGRGIAPETIKAFRVSGKPGAVAFPVLDPDGKLVNIKWRALETKKFWNEEGALKLPFGLHTVPVDAKTLLLTEGECDAMVAWQYGIRSVVSLPNGAQDLDWIEHLWEWLERFEVIQLSMDMDRAGRDGLKRLVNRLGAWRCRNVILPHKDLNDCLTAGMPAADMLAAVEGAEDFRPEKLRGVADLADAVYDLFDNRQGIVGVPTGFPSLTQILKGWRGGELTVWTGQNGSGKSTILGQEMVNLVRAGERVCIGSFELDARRYLRWLICQHLNEAEPWGSAIARALGDFVAGMWFVDHVGSIALEELLASFEYAARRYGCRHFVVDSLVKLRLRGDKLESQIKAVEALSDFADRFDAHVHMVAHPRKGESDNDRPDKTAVKGAGEITDLADNVISIHRNKQPKEGQAGAIAAVLKNREHGTEGRVPLYVNPETKRVTEAREARCVAPMRRERTRITPADYEPEPPPPNSSPTLFTGTVVEEIDFPDEETA